MRFDQERNVGILNRILATAVTGMSMPAHILEVGRSANKKEENGLARLCKALPNEWIALCNIPSSLVPARDGKVGKEIDCLVIGKRSWFIIDVKSHTGTVRAYSAQPWRINGEPILNRNGKQFKSNKGVGFYANLEPRMYELKDLLQARGIDAFIHPFIVFTEPDVEVVHSSGVKLGGNIDEFVEWALAKDKPRRSRKGIADEALVDVLEHFTEGNRAQWPARLKSQDTPVPSPVEPDLALVKELEGLKAEAKKWGIEKRALEKHVKDLQAMLETKESQSDAEPMEAAKQPATKQTRKPLVQRKAANAGGANQTFSHGRTNKVVVEVKRRRMPSGPSEAKLEDTVEALQPDEGEQTPQNKKDARSIHEKTPRVSRANHNATFADFAMLQEAYNDVSRALKNKESQYQALKEKNERAEASLADERRIASELMEKVKSGESIAQFYREKLEEDRRINDAPDKQRASHALERKRLADLVQLQNKEFEALDSIARKVEAFRPSDYFDSHTRYHPRFMHLSPEFDQQVLELFRLHHEEWPNAQRFLAFLGNYIEWLQKTSHEERGRFV
jgi:hypothetical protein